MYYIENICSFKSIHIGKSAQRKMDIQLHEKHLICV